VAAALVLAQAVTAALAVQAGPMGRLAPLGHHTAQAAVVAAALALEPIRAAQAVMAATVTFWLCGNVQRVDQGRA
jgi:hypothetical protein